MNGRMVFSGRKEFRAWLHENYLSNEGAWLLFGKADGPETLKAGEALEEVLCFRWIDGRIQSMDDKTYRKYFSLRKENSR